MNLNPEIFFVVHNTFGQSDEAHHVADVFLCGSANVNSLLYCIDTFEPKVLYLLSLQLKMLDTILFIKKKKTGNLKHGLFCR